jgi:DNA-binding MurR/RpiR family transcriptional regulator
LSIHELLQTFKRDIIASIEQKIEQKISELQNVNLSSLEFEEVTSEAVERMIRAKNVIIYGVPESSGTAEQRQTKDAAEI